MKNVFKRFASVVMLILLVAGLAVALTPALAEAADTTTPAVVNTVKPKSVKLDRKGTVKLPLGETLTLTPTLSPENAATTYKWKSSKKKIASVSSAGVVKAKKVGTTTITVTTKNKKKAKVKIKVYDPYKPTKVVLDKSGTQTLLVSNALQLTATLYPETAQSTLKWKSSNKKVAIVNSDGLVGALAPGKTTITVTTRNKKKAKIKIKVIDDGKQPITPPAGYNLPYVIYACKNTHTIAILAQDSNGEWTRVIRLFPTAMGRKNVTDVGFYYIAKKERWHKWGSGYSPYANRLSVGLYLHGPIYKQKNQNTIRYNYYNVIGTDGSSGCLRTVCGCAAWVYYNCPIGTMVCIAQNSRFSTPRPAKLKKNATTDPTDPGSNPEVLITSFAVQPGSLTLEKGATQAIIPTAVSPTNTSTKGFSFATSNGSVATVSSTGVVTAVGAGSATIVVTANDDFKCTVSVPVTVTEGAAKLAEAETFEEPEEIPVEEQFSIEDAAPAEEVAADAPAEEVAADAAAETIEDADDAEQAEDAEPVVEAEPDFQELDGLSFDTVDAEEVPEEVSELVIDDAEPVVEE